MEQIIDIHSHRSGGPQLCIRSYKIEDYDAGAVSDRPISLGLHPWSIGKVDEAAMLRKLEKHLQEPRVAAVGECGIDRAVAVNVDKQKQLFVKQNELAAALGMPLIIHSVKSYSDFLALMKKGYNKSPWIFHGFSGNFQIARRLVDKGAFVSFGAQLLRDFSKTVEALRKTPLQRIFFETDEAEVPIEDIYRKAASIRGIPYEEFVSQIYQNYIFCFNYGRR